MTVLEERVVGSGVPLRWSAPAFVSSAVDEAVECSRLAGLGLDEAQRFVLEHGLGERDDGRWSAFEVGVQEPRQNGKGGIAEARMLLGLFVLEERLLTYSAHQFDTSLEAFRRLLERIESVPDFERRVKRVSRSHGEEGIELKGGQRVRFRTRTKGGGRGFTGDVVFLDEAMILPEAAHGALLPTVSARPNPQVWYLGSAVDQQVHEHGLVFARVRERGLRGGDPRLAWFEWAAEVPGVAVEDATPDDVTPELASDVRAWAQANPALGIRISLEHVAAERRSMARRTFAVERLGVGDWPETGEAADAVIERGAWMLLVDDRSKTAGRVWFAFDVSPDRTRSSVAVAGRREDGLAHWELVQTGRGVGWLEDRLVGLNEHSPAGFVCDEAGPAASLVPGLKRRGLRVVTTTAADMAKACGMLVDAVEKRSARHLGQQELDDALRVAGTRKLGDRWAWSRQGSRGDITPLAAVTLAHWGLVTRGREQREPWAIVR